jgi:hypothetical protein
MTIPEILAPKFWPLILAKHNQAPQNKKAKQKSRQVALAAFRVSIFGL